MTHTFTFDCGRTCRRDPRHCLHHGWRAQACGDGRIALRFTCSTMTLEVERAPRVGFRWRFAKGDAASLAGGPSGTAGRLVEAARELADAARRAGLGGALGADEIVVGIILAERRARARGCLPAQPSSSA